MDLYLLANEILLCSLKGDDADKIFTDMEDSLKAMYNDYFKEMKDEIVMVLYVISRAKYYNMHVFYELRLQRCNMYVLMEGLV